MKWTLSIASVLWITFGAILLHHGEPCAADGVPKVYQCLTANELGDFLAGFFAPLAFVWLAAAVYIQSKELAEQKKELALSRQVAIEAKEAASAQAEEARRSADFFSVQTKIMESQLARQNEEVANAELQSLLIHLVPAALNAIGISTLPESREPFVDQLLRHSDRLQAQISNMRLVEDTSLLEKFRYLKELWPKISESQRLRLNKRTLRLFLEI